MPTTKHPESCDHSGPMASKQARPKTDHWGGAGRRGFSRVASMALGLVIIGVAGGAVARAIEPAAATPAAAPIAEPAADSAATPAATPGATPIATPRRAANLSALATELGTSGLAQAAPANAPGLAPPMRRGEADRAARRAARRTPVVDVFEASRDAVVNIATTEVQEVRVRRRSAFDLFFDDFDPRPRRRERQSVGSGFVIHPDGYIVTNAHVVSRTASEQKAIFPDGREYDAVIVATDRDADLAVLKIEADAPLPTLPLGRSDDILVGETVVAIGNPLGFQHTVTSGVVSATGRSIEVSRDLRFDDLIQTDASINPGNSGGPLLNVLGELIGVNTAIRGDAQNIGFAISVDRLRRALPELLDVERRYRIESGLQIDPLGVPRVVSVLGDSPAARAGIRPGDQLLEIDARPVANAIDYDIAVMGRRPGDAVRLRLDRGGQEVLASLRLAERPRPDGDALAWARLGLRLEPVDDDLARRLRLGRNRGMFVTAVAPESAGEAAGVRPRDIILALDEFYLSSVEDLGRRLERAASDESMFIRVVRVVDRRKSILDGEIVVR
ncbi:MAG: trypsin-like peptidase domain-containing protein [Phycisphaerales bacterium]